MLLLGTEGKPIKDQEISTLKAMEIPRIPETMLSFLQEGLQDDHDTHDDNEGDDKVETPTLWKSDQSNVATFISYNIPPSSLVLSPSEKTTNNPLDNLKDFHQNGKIREEDQLAVESRVPINSYLTPISIKLPLVTSTSSAIVDDEFDLEELRIEPDKPKLSTNQGERNQNNEDIINVTIRNGIKKNIQNTTRYLNDTKVNKSTQDNTAIKLEHNFFTDTPTTPLKISKSNQEVITEVEKKKLIENNFDESLNNAHEYQIEDLQQQVGNYTNSLNNTAKINNTQSTVLTGLSPETEVLENTGMVDDRDVTTDNINKEMEIEHEVITEEAIVSIFVNHQYPMKPEHILENKTSEKIEYNNHTVDVVQYPESSYIYQENPEKLLEKYSEDNNDDTSYTTQYPQNTTPVINTKEDTIFDESIKILNNEKSGKIFYNNDMSEGAMEPVDEGTIGHENSRNRDIINYDDKQEATTVNYVGITVLSGDITVQSINNISEDIFNGQIISSEEVKDVEQINNNIPNDDDTTKGPVKDELNSEENSTVSVNNNEVGSTSETNIETEMDLDIDDSVNSEDDEESDNPSFAITVNSDIKDLTSVGVSQPLLTLMSVEPHSMQLLVQPTQFEPETVVRLSYELVASNHSFPECQLSDPTVEVVPLYTESQHHMLTNLPNGHYIVCGETQRGNTIIQANCIETPIETFQPTRSYPTWEIVGIAGLLVILISITICLVSHKRTETRRKHKERQLAEKVEKFARKLEERQNQETDPVVYPGEEPYQERCIM